MEHLNDLCFRDIYKGGLWEDDLLDCRPKMTLPPPPPLGNFADIVYLKEQSFLHRIRDVCTL